MMNADNQVVSDAHAQGFENCPHYSEHATLRADIEEIKKVVHEMREILSAWGDAKGFFKTIKAIGAVVKWVASIFTAAALLWHWSKR